MPLRVAHILRKYDPDAWGGTETHVVSLSSRQRAHGVEAEVHAPAGPRSPDRALPSHVPLRRFHSFCPFLGPAHKRADLVANAGNIASLEEPLRLVVDRTLALAHVHTLGRLGGAVRTAMLATGRPYVVSVHGPLLAEAALLRDDTHRRLKGLLDLGQPLGWAFGARRVVDDAARVLCFNADEHRALAHRIGSRAVLLDQGVDVARFARGSAARARLRWPELDHGDPVVLLTGRLSDQKNQLLAVRAFAKLPEEVRLVLAGAETDRGQEREIRELAGELGVASRTLLLGNLRPEDELPDVMARADLVVVPSKHEAFGLVALEAWAARKPALLANHSGLAGLVAAFGDPSWAVGSLDPATWAAAMLAALRNPTARRAAADRGLALVRERYTWDALAGKVAHLYREVLEEHRLHRRVATG